MASKTYHVGLSGLIHRLDNLNFDPGGNTYTNWVDLKPNLLSSLGLTPPEYQELLDVMTIPGNKDKVFTVGRVRSTLGPWKGIVYSANAGSTFITPGFPGGAVTNHVNNVIIAYETFYTFYEVWCTDSSTIYACGDDGGVIRSLDGGSTFTLHAVPFTAFNQAPGTLRPSITSIHFDTPSNGVIGTSAFGGLPLVFTTTTGDTTCTWLPTAPLPANTGVLKGIYKKGNIIVAVGSAKIVCSINGGAAWIEQYTWSELGLQPFEKNGEHLTWHYEPCNEIVYFRATGRRNEIVQAAYKYGSVNSWIGYPTAPNLNVAPTSAWSTFNNHLYDPTPVTSANPANNYLAAHFYKPAEGFLGRTLVESGGTYATGYRRIDWYVNNGEITNVDLVPPSGKNEVVTAIWTEIDPTVYYSLTSCDTQETIYVQQGTDTANIDNFANEVIADISIDGVQQDGCWSVEGPITCQTNQLSNVNTLSATVTTGCLDTKCVGCYKLIACEPEIGENGQPYFQFFYVQSTNPNFDLDDYLFQVFQFNIEVEGVCPGKCFYLTTSTTCETPIEFPAAGSYVIYDDCEECKQKCPVELNTRSVKPGFYTPGCPPDYTVKTSCMYAEQVYDEMVSIRYGINICCDHDIDRWDIKKQLLDLKALYDECLCVSAICPVCVEPCNVEATLSVYVPRPMDPPVEPCNPPSGPVIITLREAPPVCQCYRIYPVSGSCTYEYVSCNGDVITGTLTEPIIDICAQAESVQVTCSPGGEAQIVETFCVCTGEPPVPAEPLGPITGPVSGICNASNVNYSLGTSNACTYNWIVPAGATISGPSNLNAVNVNFSSEFAGGTITVQGFNETCGVATSSITVSGTPIAPLLTPAVICPEASELYTASSTGATSYNWTITGDVIYSECTNPPTCSQYFVIWGGTGIGSISVTAENSCGGPSSPTIITGTGSC